MKPKKQQEEQIKSNGEDPYKMKTVEALEEKANEKDRRITLEICIVWILWAFLWFVLGSILAYPFIKRYLC